MRLMNIASGSSGNATYVGSDNTHILIDSGISRKKITEGLCRLGLSLRDLDAILLTHEHSDHVSSLGIIERTVQLPVYSTEGTMEAISASGKAGDLREMYYPVYADRAFRIGDLDIEPLRISHDAAEPVCYRINHNNSGCAVVTDLGQYDRYLIDSLKGLDALVIEANHDLKMLEAGPYPYHLKMRVSGKRGHLSNEASGKLLSELLHDDIRHIALGHISKINNYADLALMSVSSEIDTAECSYKASDFRIDIAGPDTGTEIYYF
ncbi:MAG: MBL fold metallo-hydrolase [Parasporobacterium sp.]|nr:MBL fold metallo-hydrolase [Parasporobacterium sp.]